MSDTPGLSPAVQTLLDRGVVLPCPYAVEVDDSLDPERIAPGVVVHTGCRISGNKTLIGPGSELGREGSVVIEDCQLGHKVNLRGGYFFQNTPVRNRTADIFVDTDAHVFSFGTGFTLKDVVASLKEPISFDFYFKWTYLVEREIEPRNVSSMTGDFTAEGYVLSAGGSMTLRF